MMTPDTHAGERPAHLTATEIIGRRLFRPGSYVGLIARATDKIKEKPAFERIEHRAEQRGSDFYVVQIGANDGVHNDPIRPLIQKYEWQGVLVEPGPKSFAALHALYGENDRIGLVQAAISDTNGTATLHVAKEHGGHNPMQGKDSLHRDVLDKHAWATRDINAFTEEVEVPTMTPLSLLEQMNIHEMDMLVVDTEGHDKTVLDGFPLEDMQIPIILFEHIHLDKQDRADIIERLEDIGYELSSTRKDTFAFLTE